MDSHQIAAHNILSDRRGRSELARDARVMHFHRLYPELQKLDRQIGICKADILVRLADERGQTVDRAALYELERNRKQYLASQEIPLDYDKLIPFCPECKDTGSVDGGICNCYKELLIPDISEASGLELYSGISFSNFTEKYFSRPDKIRAIRAVGEAYAEGFPGQTRNLLFWGSPGTGKTFMAVCIAREVVLRAVPVLFIRISDLLEEMNAFRTQMLSFSPDEERLTSLKARRELILSGGLLVIDELGIEARSPNTVADLLQILGTRQQKGLATLITTNLSLTDLQKTYDNRLSSRLLGDFVPFHFEGDDIRTSAAYRSR